MDIEEFERKGYLTKIGPEEWKVNAENPDDPANLTIRLEEHPESGNKLPVGGAYVIYDGDEMQEAHGRPEDAIRQIESWGFSFPEQVVSMDSLLGKIYDIKQKLIDARDEDLQLLNAEWQKVVDQYKRHPENPGLQRVPPKAREKPLFANRWVFRNCRFAGTTVKSEK